MKKREPIEVDPTTIPEVMAFLIVAQRLEEFKQHYVEPMRQLAELQDKFNTLLQSADKAMRAGGLTCADFVLTHFTTKYDAEEAYNLLGRDGFLAAGGKIESATVYTIDKDRFEATVAQGRLPDAVVAAVRKEIANYSNPKPIRI